MVSIEGDGNTISVGAGCRFTDLKIMMVGDGHRLVIGRSCRLRGKLKLEDREGNIVIGDAVTMENAYLGVYDVGISLVIGDDCMFAEQVGVRGGDMHSIVDEQSGRRINPSKNIEIGKHVWLGRGVTVLKGARIGEHVVVGAHGLVTGALPPHSLCVGSPAKPVRTGITWCRDRLPGDGHVAATNAAGQRA